jgi:cell division septum initiation protein DivIVA
VSLDFSRLQKDNEDLEKKLEVLADKIREYREDEDTLKDALLGAQRQGNALIADSKRKAAEIAEEAQANAEAIAKRAEEDRLKKKKQGEEEIAAAEKEASDIIAAANKKAADIEREMNLRTDVQKEILNRTTDEVAAYKTKIIDHYKKQLDTIKRHYNEEIELVEKIADDCENEFIKETLKRYSESGGIVSDASGNSKNQKNKDRKNKGKPPHQDKPVAAPDSQQKNTDDTIKFEIDVEEEYPDDEIIEMNLDAILGKNNTNGNDTGEVPLFKPKSDTKPTSEIFFKKSKGNNGRSKVNFSNKNQNSNQNKE